MFPHEIARATRPAVCKVSKHAITTRVTSDFVPTQDWARPICTGKHPVLSLIGTCAHSRRVRPLLRAAGRDAPTYVYTYTYTPDHVPLHVRFVSGGNGSRPICTGKQPGHI